MKTIQLIAAAVALVSACETVSDSQVTFYGYPDNDPPGADTAHDCGGRGYKAGGTGSYEDPLTFATAPGEFEQCEIAYLPLIKKYIRYEDDCAQCTSDWGSDQYHIDIWTGSPTSDGGDTQIDCENSLTTGGKYEVVRQPGKDYEVEGSELFDGSCHPEATFEDNKASNYCSGGSDVKDSPEVPFSSASSAVKPATMATTASSFTTSTALGSSSTSSEPSSTISTQATITATPSHPHHHHHGKQETYSGSTYTISANNGYPTDDPEKTCN